MAASKAAGPPVTMVNPARAFMPFRWNWPSAPISPPRQYLGPMPPGSPRHCARFLGKFYNPLTPLPARACSPMKERTMLDRKNSRDIYPATGTEITAKSWQTEAAMRMLMNNLHPDVAENPHELVVYGGIGRAARSWGDFDRIVATLKDLEDDETLLVQSGRPVAVVRTHKDAPRVLIANSNLVPHWATWDHFNELDKKGLMMFGQMTAGSWIYIGSQGIIQGTYETFCEAGRQHYHGELKGKWILTAGLGGMGGAQPLAATMAHACLLAIECDPKRIKRRLQSGYLDVEAKNLDEAIAIIQKNCEQGQPISVGLLANAADIFPECVKRGIKPDLVRSETSAHDPLNGYLPRGWTLEEAKQLRKTNPQKVIAAAKASIAIQVKAMLAFHEQGIP